MEYYLYVMTGDFGGTATREKLRGEYRCDILGIAVRSAANPACGNQPTWWITIFDGVSIRLFRVLWGFVSTVATLFHHNLSGSSIRQPQPADAAETVRTGCLSMKLTHKSPRYPLCCSLVKLQSQTCFNRLRNSHIHRFSNTPQYFHHLAM